MSGQQLDDLFTTWLFTPAKPSLAGPAGGAVGPGRGVGLGLVQRAHAQHDRGRY